MITLLYVFGSNYKIWGTVVRNSPIMLYLINYRNIGGKKMVDFCPMCGGSGHKMCTMCGGSGRIFGVSNKPGGQICTSCGGMGQETCTSCNGSGRSYSGFTGGKEAQSSDGSILQTIVKVIFVFIFLVVAYFVVMNILFHP